MLQFPAYLARGVPHVLVSGVLAAMSAGIEVRGKNQMEIASLVHSVA